MLKPIRSDLPYPTLEGLTEDRRSAVILSPAYAAAHSELAAILQYVYHHFFYKNAFPEVADLLMGIAVTEMEHLDLLGSALLKLGTAPVYSACPPEFRNFFNASCVSYSADYQKMLLDDLNGEMIAIREYRDILARLENGQLQALIERIVMDEELHVEKLKAALETVVAALDAKALAEKR